MPMNDRFPSCLSSSELGLLTLATGPASTHQRWNRSMRRQPRRARPGTMPPAPFSMTTDAPFSELLDVLRRQGHAVLALRSLLDDPHLEVGERSRLLGQRGEHRGSRRPSKCGRAPRGYACESEHAFRAGGGGEGKKIHSDATSNERKRERGEKTVEIQTSKHMRTCGPG